MSSNVRSRNNFEEESAVAIRPFRGSDDEPNGGRFEPQARRDRDLPENNEGQGLDQLRVSAPGTSRSRHYLFTKYAYTSDHVASLRGPNAKITFLRCQAEQCPTTQRKHLQGYVIFANALALRGAKRALDLGDDLHLDVKSKFSTSQQCIDYCSKEESRIVGDDAVDIQIGEPPVGQGKRSDLEGVFRMIHAQEPITAIVESYPADFMRYHAGITKVIDIFNNRKRDFKTEVHWYYGSTGTGKSKLAFELSPDAYVKCPTNKWWDGFNGYDDVIVDDYRCDFSTFATLLRLFDRYPCTVEFKGGTMQFRPKKIFITTPKSPELTWANRSAEDISQLTRRIDVVKCFDAPNPNPNRVRGFNPDVMDGYPDVYNF